mgnify:FL=1
MKHLLGAVAGVRNRFNRELDGTLADPADFPRPRLAVLDVVRVLTAHGIEAAGAARWID